MANQNEAPEFARPVVLEEIGPDGLDLEIEANADERRRLTERLGLLSLDSLTGRLHLAVPSSGVSVRVTGRFQAHYSQECVVSLDPVESNLDEAVEAEFGPIADEPIASVTLDGPDPAEPLVDGRIDLGELVVQHLALALDPYPRKSDACPPQWTGDADISGVSSNENPFSVLAALRKKDW